MGIIKCLLCLLHKIELVSVRVNQDKAPWTEILKVQGGDHNYYFVNETNMYL